MEKKKGKKERIMGGKRRKKAEKERRFRGNPRKKRTAEFGVKPACGCLLNRVCVCEREREYVRLVRVVRLVCVSLKRRLVVFDASSGFFSLRIPSRIIVADCSLMKQYIG